MTTAFEEYLAALRELDEVRNGQADAAAAARSHTEWLAGNAANMEQRLEEQGHRLEELAVACDYPRPAAHPRPAVAVNPDPAAETPHVGADLEAADSDYRQARYLAHRPRLFPAWRADDRNGLVYGCFGLAGLLAQTGVLMFASGVQRFSDALGYLAVVFVIPFIAWVAGWTVIGAISRPVIGEPARGPDGKIPRHWRMGLLICLSSWLVSCWLGSAYLT